MIHKRVHLAEMDMSGDRSAQQLFNLEAMAVRYGAVYEFLTNVTVVPIPSRLAIFHLLAGCFSQES